MNEDSLGARFEKNRAHLRAVADRMLGSSSEAEDAVQETWLRFSRTDTSGVDNLAGWLTTVLSRVCLDLLRSRKSRVDSGLGVSAPEAIPSEEPAANPERELLLADAVGSAMTLVLDALTPAERVAFVLHDLFALSFDEIGRILERSPAAVRQLASRARRRVQGAGAAEEAREADLPSHREVVEAFLAASRNGDFGALLAVLDPQVVLRVDATALKMAAAREAQGAPKLSGEMRGAQAVARTFLGGAQAAQPALLDGAVGAVWAPGGRPRGAFAFRIAHGKIVEMQIVADPRAIDRLDVVFLA